MFDRSEFRFPADVQLRVRTSQILCLRSEPFDPVFEQNYPPNGRICFASLLSAAWLAAFAVALSSSSISGGTVR